MYRKAFANRVFYFIHCALVHPRGNGENLVRKGPLKTNIDYDMCLNCVRNYDESDSWRFKCSNKSLPRSAFRILIKSQLDFFMKKNCSHSNSSTKTRSLIPFDWKGVSKKDTYKKKVKLILHTTFGLFVIFMYSLMEIGKSESSFNAF